MIYELTSSIVRTNRCVNLYHGHIYMVAFLLNGEQGLDSLHGHFMSGALPKKKKFNFEKVKNWRIQPDFLWPVYLRYNNRKIFAF